MTPSPSTRVVLHFAPHPDDECLGAPAGLLRLASLGYQVISIACTYGRRDQQLARRLEARRAHEILGFQLVDLEHVIGLSANEDLVAAESELAIEVERLLVRFHPEIVVSPSPHDRHHGHEVVGRAVMRALENNPQPQTRWWLWGLWADLPFPNVFIPFDATIFSTIESALSAHKSELARNDYRDVLRGRSISNAALGSERVFGFGTARYDCLHAELITELLHVKPQNWLLTKPRLFGTDAFAPGDICLDKWLHRASITSQLRKGGRMPF